MVMGLSVSSCSNIDGAHEKFVNNGNAQICACEASPKSK